MLAFLLDQLGSDANRPAMLRVTMAGLVASSLGLSGCFVLFHDGTGEGGNGGASSNAATNAGVGAQASSTLSASDATGSTGDSVASSSSAGVGGADACGNVGGTCVAPGPNGWSGPVTMESGACAGGAVPIYAGGAPVGSNVLLEPACSCSPQSPFCGGLAVKFASNNLCTNQNGGVTIGVGTCTSISPVPVALGIGPVPAPTSMDACVADNGQTPAPVAYQDPRSLCTLGDCSGGDMCVGPGPVCVYTEASPAPACPTGYPTRTKLSDAKDPLSCKCQALALGTCDGVLKTYSDGACSTQLASSSPSTCFPFGTNPPAALSVKYVRSGGSPCGAGTWSGPLHDVVVCCSS